MKKQFIDYKSNEVALKPHFEAALHHARTNPALTHAMLSSVRHFPLDTLVGHSICYFLDPRRFHCFKPL